MTKPALTRRELIERCVYYGGKTWCFTIEGNRVQAWTL